MNRTLYQLEPQASKGNAFCWLSWQGAVEWCPPPPQGRPTTDYTERGRQQTARVQEMRSRGIDPLHIPGLGSQCMANPATLDFTTRKKVA